MFIKTYTGTLVNLNKLNKIDIASSRDAWTHNDQERDDWSLRGWLEDYKDITLFVGTYDECNIAMQNLEEAIITKAKILSYYEYSMKDDDNE